MKFPYQEEKWERTACMAQWIGVSLGPGTSGSESPLCHGSSQGDLGPSTISQPNLTHRVILRISGGEGTIR